MAVFSLSRMRPIVLIVVLAVLAALLTVVVAHPERASATATGTGGEFVSTSGRIFDTRTGQGGFSTPFAANTYRTVQVAGLAGVPTSGVSAVTYMTTVLDSSGVGQMNGRPNSSTSATLMNTYNGGGLGNTSNTATVAMTSAGTIQIVTNTAADVILDVEGYYTSTKNGVAPGGFVSIPGSRIVNTENGTGAPKATIPAGGSLTVQVTGTPGVPAGASAVAANFQVVNSSSNSGYITPYQTGSTRPETSLNYAGGNGVQTSDTAQVALNAAGQLTVWNDTASSATINLIIDTQGYFTASAPGGGFTPDAKRIYDTRVSPNTTFASNEQRAIQIAGLGDVPAMGSGVSAVAVTLTALHAPNNTGNSTVWPDGTTKPTTTAINFTEDSIRSDLVILPLGTDGKIDLNNVSAGSTDFVIDIQGWYNSLPTGPETTNLTGSRSSATNLSFPIDDQTTAQVDVATGNLLVSNSGLTLTGIASSVPFGAAYNSRGWEADNTASMDANKWAYDLDSAGALSANSKGVVYTGADGSTWQFTLNSDGSFTAPAGLLATLTKESNEYQLKYLTSNSTTHFNLSGQPTSIVDRNSNEVDFTYSGFLLSKVTTNAGPLNARTAAVVYSGSSTTITQTNGSATRSISYAKDGAGNITSYTDADGKTTTFAYTGTDLTSVTAPDGGVTSFTYNSSDQVTEVDQPASTGSGTAATRLSYVSSTETQVADADTDQGQTVASVPNTTYTLDSSTHDVTKAVDPDGDSRSATYNAANNGVASSTVGSSADAAGSQSTTSGTYGANNSQSLTQVKSPTGGSGDATYGSSASEYLPSSTKSASGNTTSYTYDNLGNEMTSSTGSGSTAATASLAHNSNGTVKSATAPLNAAAGSTAANPSTYQYDSNNQLSSITPPMGSSVTLGVKHFTYDSFGRLTTETDGSSNTTTFTYDNDDRPLTEAFSDGTATVTNTYDGNGNQLTSQSAAGTITDTFDPDNRMLTTANSAGGGTISYAYDLTGNETSTTDSKGTVTYAYDPSNVLWSMTYPHGSATETDRYKIDSHGRRTDSYVNAGPNGTAMTNATNTAPTTFTAHTNTAYDTSSRISEQTAYVGQDATKVFDTTYGYETAASGGTGTASDSDQLQTATDTLTGKVTTYGYEDPNGNPTTRLTGVTQTGGTGDVNWAYTYDADGNMTEAKATGATTSDTKLTFNAANQITTPGYSYDAAGNLTASPGETYTYNGAEQMTSAAANGVTTTFTYAGASQDQLLTQATTGQATVSYTYGQSAGTGVPEVDTETLGGNTSRVLHDGSTGQALDLTDSDGNTAASLVDGLGNQVGALTDTGGGGFNAFYTPYGMGGATSNGGSDFWTQNPYGFKDGIRSDAAGLVKFGQRWYLAGIGGWTQEDTLDAPLDPGNGDRYAYVGDNPINNADPTGNDAEDLVDIGFAAFDAFGIGHAVAEGDSEGIAKGVTGLLVGTLVGATCTGAIAAGTGGVGLLAGVGCGVLGEAAGRLVTNDWSL